MLSASQFRTPLQLFEDQGCRGKKSSHSRSVRAVLLWCRLAAKPRRAPCCRTSASWTRHPRPHRAHASGLVVRLADLHIEHIMCRSRAWACVGPGTREWKRWTRLQLCFQSLSAVPSLCGVVAAAAVAERAARLVRPRRWQSTLSARVAAAAVGDELPFPAARTTLVVPRFAVVCGPRQSAAIRHGVAYFQAARWLPLWMPRCRRGPCGALSPSLRVLCAARCVRGPFGSLGTGPFGFHHHFAGASFVCALMWRACRIGGACRQLELPWLCAESRRLDRAVRRAALAHGGPATWRSLASAFGRQASGCFAASTRVPGASRPFPRLKRPRRRGAFVIRIGGEGASSTKTRVPLNKKDTVCNLLFCRSVFFLKRAPPFCMPGPKPKPVRQPVLSCFSDLPAHTLLRQGAAAMVLQLCP